jgi:hypothetical protein
LFIFVFTVQLEQVAEPSTPANVPLEQREHPVAAPWENLPPAQRVQALEAGMALYFPAPHAVHPDADASPEYLP